MRERISFSVSASAKGGIILPPSWIWWKISSSVFRLRTSRRFGALSVPKPCGPWQKGHPDALKRAAPSFAEGGVTWSDGAADACPSRGMLDVHPATIKAAQAVSARRLHTYCCLIFFGDMTLYGVCCDGNIPSVSVVLAIVFPCASKSWMCQGTDSCAISPCFRR